MVGYPPSRCLASPTATIHPQAFLTHTSVIGSDMLEMNEDIFTATRALDWKYDFSEKKRADICAVTFSQKFFFFFLQFFSLYVHTSTLSYCFIDYPPPYGQQDSVEDFYTTTNKSALRSQTSWTRVSVAATKQETWLAFSVSCNTHPLKTRLLLQLNVRLYIL